MQKAEEQIFQDHLSTSFKTMAKSAKNEDSFKTNDQKTGKSVPSGPSVKSAKNGPTSTSFKTIKSQNVPKLGSFKTIEDGSQNDTSFKTMANKDQKPTSFKTIENKVKNLNPRYMVPVDEASQVISDPQARKKAQPITEQPSSGPPPSGSRFNPIYVEPRLVSIGSTRDLQALFPNSFDCIGDMKGKYNIKTDPTAPPVQHGRQKLPIYSTRRR